MELTHPDDAISTLMAAHVVDEDGRRLGRVRDVEGHWRDDGTVIVDGLRLRRGLVVPWSDILSVQDETVTVRRTSAP